MGQGTLGKADGLLRHRPDVSLHKYIAYYGTAWFPCRTDTRCCGMWELSVCAVVMSCVCAVILGAKLVEFYVQATMAHSYAV